MQLKFSPIFIFALIALHSPHAFSAPCCGGSSAIPTLITGDDRAQLQASISHGSIIGDAPSAGIPVFRASSDREGLDVFNLAGAYRLFDRGQIGLGVPVISRSRNTPNAQANAAGIGDLILDFAYEAIPDFDYSVWRPKGFVFVQMTLPTSASTYDSVVPFQIDARGRGFYTLGLGAAFLKTISNWDFILSLELHRSLRRTVTAQDGSNLFLVPNFGGTAMVGAGYSPGGGNLRFGISLAPIYEGSIDVYGAIDSTSDPQFSWSTSFQCGYLITDEWSAGASYIDQTLMGPASNVSLSRSVLLSVQRRWPL